MAFPTVAAGNTSTELVATTTHSVDLPATVNAGELLDIKITTGGEPLIFMPLDWDNAFNPEVFVSTSLANFKKIADGTEGGTSVTFTTDIAVKSAHIACAITGWVGDLRGVVAGAAVTANTTTPNPPNVISIVGIADNLFMPIMSMQRTLSITGYPAGYIDNQTEVTTGSGGQDSLIAIATQGIAAASDNPGSFTAAIQRRSVAQTLVIAPAGSVIPDVVVASKKSIPNSMVGAFVGSMIN